MCSSDLNFVELKATRMARGAKANHLAYLGDSDIGVVGQRMRDDVEPRFAEQVEEALRITDAGYRMDGRRAERIERALAAVAQVIHARDDRVAPEYATMPPIAAVDDDRIHRLQPSGRLAQRTGRQTEAVAHAADAIHDRDLETPTKTVVLETVIGQHDVDPAGLEQRLSRRHAVRTGNHGATGAAREQHGLVADRGGI